MIPFPGSRENHKLNPNKDDQMEALSDLSDPTWWSKWEFRECLQSVFLYAISSWVLIDSENLEKVHISVFII